MYAITGISGRVGAAAAQALRSQGIPVRGIFRDAAKAAAWKAPQDDVRVLELRDVDALSSAFEGVKGAFVMVPPNFAPLPGFPEARADIDAIMAALRRAAVPHIVALSSVGSQHSQGLGLITQTRMLEEALSSLQASSTVLRPAWFMENTGWDIAAARATGRLDCYLGPLDRPFPMVATADIGKLAAQSLVQGATGARLIELEGPRRYSQFDIADMLTKILGHEVQAHTISRAHWPAHLGGSADSLQPRLEMLDGFNSGHIDFEGGAITRCIGQTTFESVLRSLAS